MCTLLALAHLLGRPSKFYLQALPVPGLLGSEKLYLGGMIHQLCSFPSSPGGRVEQEALSLLCYPGLCSECPHYDATHGVPTISQSSVYKEAHTTWMIPKIARW